jgi:hypothetical protein
MPKPLGIGAYPGWFPSCQARSRLWMIPADTVLADCYLIRSVSLVILMLAPTTLNSVDPRARGLALGLMWLPMRAHRRG